MKYYSCPVCDYPYLEEPPYAEDGWGSFEICPQCGIEFGVVGVNEFLQVFNVLDCDKMIASPERLAELHKHLREEWIAGGKKWWADWMTVEERNKPRADDN